LGCLPSYCGNPGGKLWTNEAFIYNYDMANFYTKAVYDWDDSKLEDGMLTDTAPSVGIQYCGVGWAMAHPHTQLKLYQYYGDKRIIEQQYQTSKKWLDLVTKSNPANIILLCHTSCQNKNVYLKTGGIF